MGLPEYLPILEGWRHRWLTYMPGDIKAIAPGDSFNLVKKEEKGWGWSVIVVSRTNAFYELKIAIDDFTPRYNMMVSSPFQATMYDFTVPDDHIWCPPLSYAAGVFALCYTPANFRPYRKLVWISVKAADVNPVTGAKIAVPLIIDAALVVRIQIHDEKAFVRSVRKLNTPLSAWKP